MNTPAHAALNLFLLNRDNHRHSGTTMIVVGAVLPDIAIIIFYAWNLMIGTAEQTIWSIEYFRPGWQSFIDLFNSIPLLMLFLLISWKLKQPLLILLFASMLLHTLGDLPLHHDDAHRHFFPFSDWRFVSPVSYWNPDYHGSLVSLIEGLMVAGIAFFLFFKWSKLRYWIAGISLTYLGYLGYVFLVWQ